MCGNSWLDYITAGCIFCECEQSGWSISQ